MNKRLSRYFKRVIAFISAFVVFFAGIYLTSFRSWASELDHGLEFNLNYPEPSANESQGYILLFLQNKTTGVYTVETYFWTTIGSVNGVESPTYAYLTLNSSSFKFTMAGSSGSNVSGYYCLTRIGDTGNYYQIANSSSSAFTFDFNSTNKTLLGYKYKGNVGYVSGTFSLVPFTAYFNADASALLLRDIWDLLFTMYYQDSDIASTVVNILNSVDGIENQLSSVVNYLRSIDSELDSIRSQLDEIYSKADDILNEQKETNSWLEKIYNKIVEALGLQGEESTEKLPDEEVGSVLEEEDNLMQDTTDAENSLDFSVDSNSNNVVWNIIERVLNANPRVFGAFIGIMTLGVITLLLNR